MFVLPVAKIEHNLDRAIARLLERVRHQAGVDAELIEKAIEFGKKAHEGQLRKSGEPYFIHPVRVALELCHYDMNTLTILGALLHDVIEDTAQDQSSIEARFGAEAAKLVHALTKVKTSKNLTLFKIFELGKEDFRVFLIKLMDRIDNLSDMDALHLEKKRRVCAETLDIYVEMAQGFGLTEIAERLMDLVFRQLYPRVYQDTANKLEELYKERRAGIEAMVERIQECIHPDRLIRVEPLYIKPQAYLYSRDEIIRILDAIVVEVPDPLCCYQALGEVHMKLRNIPLSMRDYISNPKANGWRGLTSKVLVEGEAVSVHFVTSSFHRKNRLGILALMKEGVYQSENYGRFLQFYLDVAKDENVRVDDVFRFSKEKQIQVFTPKGDVVELRYGSTILDFAFMVHSQIGLHAQAGVIDQVRYPTEKILEDGQVIKVLTARSVKPTEEWLKQVVMPKSRREILRALGRKK